MDHLELFVVGMLFGISIGLVIGILIGSKSESNKEKKMVRWTRVRKMGQLRFMLVFGSIFWGLSMAIMTFLFGFLFHPGPNPVLDLAIRLVLYPLGGFLVGWFWWRSSEKSYRKWLRAQVELDFTS